MSEEEEVKMSINYPTIPMSVEQAAVRIRQNAIELMKEGWRVYMCSNAGRSSIAFDTEARVINLETDTTLFDDDGLSFMDDDATRVYLQKLTEENEK